MDMFKGIFSLERVIDGYLFELKSSCVDIPKNLEEQEKDAIEKQTQIEAKTKIVEKERIRARALADDVNAGLNESCTIINAA